MIPNGFREAQLSVNGFSVTACFSEAQIENEFIPLLKELSEAVPAGGRSIVFLAAPPGAGKSTFAAFLAQLSRERPEFPELQVLGMDGFHFPQAYLRTHTAVRDGKTVPLSSVKGAPESFDLTGLDRALRAILAGEEVFWPLYDRTLHDVVPHALRVEAPLLLVEGNWLLLDAPGWRELPHGMSVFLTEDEKLLRERLIQRKIWGGLSPEEALAFYRASDEPNVRLCLASSLPADRVMRIVHPSN